MGAVVPFPTHARTSALKPKAARSGGGLPKFASSSEKRKKCSGGITPLVRQLLTAEGYFKPASEAVAVLPPKASTMSSTDLSIPPYTSRSVNLSTVHASAVDCDLGFRFKLAMRESLKSLGNRLAQTREALGLSAAELCKRIDCKPNRWSQYESGDRKITLEIADRLCDEFGLSLDWIYRANRAMLPDSIRVKIPRIAA